MKVGDLVRCRPFDFTFEEKSGVILGWVRHGGCRGSVWEVLCSGDSEHWDENDLEVINESR